MKSEKAPYKKASGVGMGFMRRFGCCSHYYARYDGSLIVNKKYCAWKLDATADLPTGNYTFGPDGRMCEGIVSVNGVLGDYEAGKPVDKGRFLF